MVRPEAEKRSLDTKLKELVVAIPDFLHDSVVFFLEVLEREARELRNI